MRGSTLSVVLIALALAPARAAGAGFYLYEFGSPSVGLASAGYAARAADAETLFTNPAGMVRLEGTEFLGGLQALYGSAAFSPGPSTIVPGNGGGNAIGWLPGGSLFLVAEVAPRLKVGVGALQYFGLGLEYDAGWVGRYYGQKGALIGLSLVPSAAWRVTDWLSVGAGLNAMFGLLRGTVAVNNVPESLPDGQIALSDNAWGFGANVGVLVEPAKGTRVGLTWLSALYLGFSTVPSYTGLGPGLEAALRASGILTAPVGLGMTLPNRIMVGVHQELGSAWALMADFGWESWSQFGKVEVSIDASNPVGLTKTVGYQDTWHLAAGATWRPAEAWRLSGGVAYDSSMMAEPARTVMTPVGAAWRFALGGQWAVSRSVSLGIAADLRWTA
jgi:long-chain fatty acid transport protein